MFKSLQFQDKKSKRFNFQIKRKEVNEKKPSLININGQKYVIQRTNLDYQKRFSQKVQQTKPQPKRNSRPMLAKKVKADVSNNDENVNSINETIKIKRDNYLKEDAKTVRKKMVVKMKNGIDMFKREQMANREDRQLELNEGSLKLEKYDQQRQNFINYLAYLIQYVNHEQKDDRKIRTATFFKAIQIFDMYLSKQNDKLDQQQVFTTTQACILIASKVEDIYYIELDQIEYDSNLQKKLLVQEQKILETIDYDVHRISEFNLMNQYLEMFRAKNEQTFRKTSLKNLMILMKDHKIRQFSNNEVVQAVLVYSFIQEFMEDFGKLEALILEQKWDQDMMHQIITMLEKKIQQKQAKYLENINSIIS